jgi:hypothetical protein
MISTSHKVHKILAVFAYLLLIAAVLPKLARYDQLTWALVPVWLIATGYVSAILKTAAPDQRTSKKFEAVTWLVWLSYFVLAIVWPLHMHWYDSLVTLALFATPGSGLMNGLMCAYYVLSASGYLVEQNALQVMGRSVLAALAATATANTWPSEADGPGI